MIPKCNYPESTARSKPSITRRSRSMERADAKGSGEMKGGNMERQTRDRSLL